MIASLFVSFDHVDVKVESLEYRFEVRGEPGRKKLGKLVAVTVDYAHPFRATRPDLSKTDFVSKYSAAECPVVKRGIGEARAAAIAALAARNADASIAAVVVSRTFNLGS